MAFWTDAQGRDPKRKYRFILRIAALPAGGSWFVKTSDRPSVEVSNTEHKFLNHTFNYPGSVTWNEVSVTLVDPVDPDMQHAVADVIAASGYYVPNRAPTGKGRDSTTISKSKATAALINVEICMIDGDGVEIEKWTLHNPWISGVENSNLEYGADDLSETTLKFKYDWASLDKPDGGHGGGYSQSTQRTNPHTGHPYDSRTPVTTPGGGSTDVDNF